MSKTIYRHDYRLLLDDLRQRREGLGLSQADAARALGWSQRKYSYAETGARRLDVLEFIAMTRALGLTPAEALAVAESRVRAVSRKARGTKEGRRRPSAR